MSDQDRLKWNRKYKEKPALLEIRPPSTMIQRFHTHTRGKKALDLACGTGRHSLFLAEHGFHVDAVDISEHALETLKAHKKAFDIHCIETDLDAFLPEKDKYDLAVMTNYLDRALIERTAQALKGGALFIIETYMIHPENEKENANPDFLLQPEELKHLFADTFTLLAYEEFWNEPHELYRMRKQAIAVEKSIL